MTKYNPDTVSCPSETLLDLMYDNNYYDCWVLAEKIYEVVSTQKYDDCVMKYFIVVKIVVYILILMCMNEYIPDQVSHPGETLADLLKERNITIKQLANLLHTKMAVESKDVFSIVYFQDEHHTLKELSKIVRCIFPVNAMMAIGLEKVLGISRTFWIERQKHYDIIASLKQSIKQ